MQDLRLQISSDRLYGAEQMSIGSYSTVRGYAEAVGSGNSGAVLRSGLYLVSAFWTAPFAEGAAAWLSQTTQAHVFIDTGVVWDNARRTREGAIGTGLGFSWTKGRLTATGILAAPQLEGGAGQARRRDGAGAGGCEWVVRGGSTRKRDAAPSMRVILFDQSKRRR